MPISRWESQPPRRYASVNDDDELEIEVVERRPGDGGVNLGDHWNHDATRDYLDDFRERAKCVVRRDSFGEWSVVKRIQPWRCEDRFLQRASR